MTPTPPQPNTGDERLKQALLMYLRDKAFNDAVGPVRKKIAGEWVNQRDFTLISKLVDKHLPGLLSIVKAELGAAIGEDEKTLTTRQVIPGSIDPSPTGTLDELSYTERQRIRNEFRTELRNHFGIGEEV